MAIDPLSMAVSAGGEIIGGLVNRAFGHQDRKNQLKQQEKLTAIQEASNLRMLEAQSAEQERMFGITHGAQMQGQKDMFDYTYKSASDKANELKDAGLNVGLAYGNALGGGGGTTGSASGHTGGGASSGTGGFASSEAELRQARNQELGLRLQRKMQEAQIKLVEAQRNDVESQTIERDGVNKDLKLANIKDITQTITNKEAQEAGQKLQNDYDKIRNYISEQTVNYDIGYIGYVAGQAREQWQMLINNREISDDTKDEIIKNYELMNKNIITDMMLKDKQSKVSDAQANKLAEDVLQGWKDLDIKEKQGDRRLNNEERANDIKTRYPSLNQLGGGLLQEVILTIDKLNPLSNNEWTAK